MMPELVYIRCRACEIPFEDTAPGAFGRIVRAEDIRTPIQPDDVQEGMRLEYHSTLGWTPIGTVRKVRADLRTLVIVGDKYTVDASTELRRVVSVQRTIPVFESHTAATKAASAAGWQCFADSIGGDLCPRCRTEYAPEVIDAIDELDRELDRAALSLRCDNGHTWSKSGPSFGPDDKCPECGEDVRHAMISTARHTEDRDGDVIDPAGVDISKAQMSAEFVHEDRTTKPVRCTYCGNRSSVVRNDLPLCKAHAKLVGA